VIPLVLAWVLQLVGIGASATFLVLYTVNVWRPWQGRRPDFGASEQAARQLLLSLPAMLLALLIPGAINALLGHTMVFSSPSSIVGKAIADALLWFPWRLYWKARP